MLQFAKLPLYRFHFLVHPLIHVQREEELHADDYVSRDYHSYHLFSI